MIYTDSLQQDLKQNRMVNFTKESYKSSSSWTLIYEYNRKDNIYFNNTNSKKYYVYKLLVKR